MSGISDSLNSASSYMASLESSLSVIQENVDNASTPGYARQDIVGAIGSSSDSDILTTQSSRSSFAESAVQQQNTSFGFYSQLASSLTNVQQNFTATGTTGIPNAIDNLFSSFSALATNPNDSSSRQQVINEAGAVAQTFNSTADSLGSIQSATRQQISSEVGTINQLAAAVQQYNVEHQASVTGAADPIVDAKLNDSLEQLSAQANVQAITQSDGSVTLLLGGQTALVVGETQYPLTADVSAGPNVTIQDANGNDVTSQITGGSLGASLQVVNQTLPGYVAQLNQLASGVADAVNTQLAAGVDSNGNPGAPLFSYTAGSAASSLAVTGITTDQVAAASVGAAGGNGNALALSALSTSQTMTGGYTFAAFYGNLAATVGADVSNATSNQSEQTQLLAQARAQRTAVSGVSLDDEAVQLVQFQRAYEAVAKLVNVLDQVTEDTINMIPAS